MIGETLGKYQIVELLGRGGMAEVYKAYQPALERWVAIKVLHAFLAVEKDFLTRFQREARAVAALRHPNIVQVYDFDYDQARRVYYMVMEFIDGPTLKERLRDLEAQGAWMEIEEAVRVTAAVADALDYAHRRGMVHRDVKPANIMFNSEGQVILTDFGIAKMVNLSGVTASGAVVGTPAYISPEQGLGRAGDERSDIYSLGVVFYQLLTGVLPFEADTPMGVVLKHINDPLPAPRSIRPDLPPHLEGILFRVLAKEPDHRYQTAAEFARELRAAVGKPLPVETTVVTPESRTMVLPRPAQAPPAQVMPPPAAATLPPAAVTPLPAPPRRRRWWLPLTLGVAMLALLVMAAAAVVGGGLIGRLLQQPTPGPAVGTTPDLEATAFAATLQAIQQIQATLSAPTPTPTATPTATPTPDLTATAQAACVDTVAVVEDPAVRPAVLAPGQAFTKRWVVRNAGECAWRPGLRLVFVSGERMGGPPAVEVEALAAGADAEIVLSLQAPPGNGTYTAVWQLQGADGVFIGPEMRFSVVVGPTPTPPPPTATPTPEATPTPSAPLGMSVPAFGGRCGVDVDHGTWTATLVWSVWGGSGEYHYFVGGVDANNELSGPAYTFTAQRDHAVLLKFYTTSAPVDQLLPLPAECGAGVAGRCVTPAGHEVVWQTVRYDESNCPP